MGWGGTALPSRGGGWLLGQLEDLQGRFNINLLVEQKQSDGESAGEGSEVQPAERDSELDAAGTRYSEQQKQFVRLLGALDGIEISPQEAISIMEAIADYIDEDVQRRVQGAEDGDYRNTNPAYRTSGRPLASVSELRSVAGITPEIYSALAPYITVWPQEGGTINVLTAPAAVLRSLNTEDSLEPLSTEEGQRLVEARAAGAITSVDDLLNDIAFASGDGEQLRSLLAERSDWFLLTARVEIADREMRLYSVLERTGRRFWPVIEAQGSCDQTSATQWGIRSGRDWGSGPGSVSMDRDDHRCPRLRTSAPCVFTGGKSTCGRRGRTTCG